MEFGHRCLDLFQFDPDYLNINHGSYGQLPKCILKAKKKYMKEMDWNPEKWFRIILEQKLTAARAIAAEFINAGPNYETVFCLNASDSFNAVIKNLKLGPKDKVMIMESSYVMVQKTTQFLQDTVGIEVVKVPITVDCLKTSDSIIKQFRDFLEQEPNIKLACIEHIGSFPSTKFPIEELIPLLRQKNIMVIVDGAHSVGQIEVDIEALAPDFYFTNFHKWAYAPRGAATLSIRKEFVNLIHPNIINNEYGLGIQKEFFWPGTQDQTNYLCIPDGIELMKTLGIKEMRNYQHKMAIEGGKIIANIFGTDCLYEDESLVASMNMVRFPSNDVNLIKRIQNELFNEKMFILY